MYADVSRAYFYAKSIRPTFVDIPPEYFQKGDEGMVAQLNFSMCETRDAAHNWSEECSSALCAAGFIRSIANPCLFKHIERDISVVVHGDDFMAVASEPDVMFVKKLPEDKYNIDTEILGPGKEDKSRVRILNREVRWTVEDVRLEADPRHAEIITTACRTESLQRFRGASR